MRNRFHHLQKSLWAVSLVLICGDLPLHQWGFIAKIFNDSAIAHAPSRG